MMGFTEQCTFAGGKECGMGITLFIFTHYLLKGIRMLEATEEVSP